MNNGDQEKYQANIPEVRAFRLRRQVFKIRQHLGGGGHKIEIRILKNYTTAYDPDKVIEELKDSTVEFELFGTCSDYVEINHAIEIIKRGGGTDKDEK